MNERRNWKCKRCIGGMMCHVLASGPWRPLRWRSTCPWPLERPRCAWKEGGFEFCVSFPLLWYVTFVNHWLCWIECWIHLGSQVFIRLGLGLASFGEVVEPPILQSWLYCCEGFDSASLHLATFVLYSCIGHIWQRLYHSMFQAGRHDKKYQEVQKLYSLSVQSWYWW